MFGPLKFYCMYMRIVQHIDATYGFLPSATIFVLILAVLESSVLSRAETLTRRYIKNPTDVRILAVIQ